MLVNLSDRELGARREKRQHRLVLEKLASGLIGLEEAIAESCAATESRRRYELAFDGAVLRRVLAGAEYGYTGRLPRRGRELAALVARLGFRAGRHVTGDRAHVASTDGARPFRPAPRMVQVGGVSVRRRIIVEMFAERHVTAEKAIELLGKLPRTGRKNRKTRILRGFDRPIRMCGICGMGEAHKHSDVCSDCLDLARWATSGHGDAYAALVKLAGDAAKVSAAIEDVRAGLATHGTQTRQSTLRTMGAALRNVR